MPIHLAVSTVVATIAFWAYTRTLLPGVDLGDTGGFQAAVLWPEVSARQAYPLYYALARPFVGFLSPADPARGLNLFSAVWAAVAVGLLSYFSSVMTRSLVAGIVAGGMLAFSYTFWTQAIIAEVYTLHLSLILICFLALHSYSAKPSISRLIVFFVAYAVSFGNHLGMILLLLPFAAFLIQVTPPGQSLFSRRVIALAAAIAAGAALQYLPNFVAVWNSFDAPASWGERVAGFWFDVTKQDWRESMVLGVGADRVGDRLGMWWFDARQQFGVAGLAMAAIGAVALMTRSRAWAGLLSLAFVFSTLFALTYNVGDSHVFFLPGHLITALWAGAGAGAMWQVARLNPSRSSSLTRLSSGALIIIVALGYVAWRGHETWPAVDRHQDRRGTEVIDALTLGIGDRNAVLVTQMNWQLENVLLYQGRHSRKDLAWVRLGEVLAHWPFFVRDAHRLGRDVVLSAEAAAAVAAAYGPAFPLFEDPAFPVMSLRDAATRVPRGMPYVLAVLTPPREMPLEYAALTDALSALTGDTLIGEKAPALEGVAFQLFAGFAGERPLFSYGSGRPFTVAFRIGDERLRVRMDSWLPTDTFRRPGFGHVLRGRDHILTLERGVNLIWLRSDGSAAPPYYSHSLFARQPRFRIPAATLQLAQIRQSRPELRLSEDTQYWREP